MSARRVWAETNRLVGIPTIVVVSIGLGLALYTVHLSRAGWKFPLVIAMTCWPYGLYALAMLMVRGLGPRWSAVYSSIVGLGVIAAHGGILRTYWLGKGQSSTEGLVLGVGALAQGGLVALSLAVVVVTEAISRDIREARARAQR